MLPLIFRPLEIISDIVTYTRLLSHGKRIWQNLHHSIYALVGLRQIRQHNLPNDRNFLEHTYFENFRKHLVQIYACAHSVVEHEWRHMHEVSLSAWAAAAKNALLVQPSSAACERVFSLLNNSFNAQHDSTTLKPPSWRSITVVESLYFMILNHN